MPLICINKKAYQKWLKFSLVLWLLSAWQIMPVSAAQFNNQEAFETVQTATSELLGQLVDNREAYREDKQLFYVEIEALLAPVVDFERIARRIMAKHYKRANADQRERFVQIFKKSLMKLYALGLLEYDNQKVVTREIGKSTSSKKQKVDVDIYSTSGEKYPISYSMFLDSGGEWKMENVIVNGINIGLTYRNQFARLMRENKNDIDLVITDWSSEVNNDD